jgi:metal-sulfur cluster biosynthetic enzyme
LRARNEEARRWRNSRRRASFFLRSGTRGRARVTRRRRTDSGPDVESQQEVRTVTEKEVRNALKTVKDPELHLDLVVLGLVYDIDVAENGDVKVLISLTSPGCPVAGQIVEDAKIAVMNVDGVEKAEVELTFDPPWTPERISPLIRSSLGL